uniref:Uncharacterized protein n=1 Tax=Anopheles funestus TaxID=62324 RepID=A0A182R3K8_ANOFN
MKYTFAFVLIALFALISISQAMPHPEEAEAAAAASNDDASAESTIELDINPADFEALLGRKFPLKAVIKTIGQIADAVKEYFDENKLSVLN